MWLAQVWLRRDSPGIWQNDWYCFYSAGTAFRDVGPGEIYRTQCIDQYWWLYPPYMLYPYALASFLPPLVYYGLAVLGIMTLTAMSLTLLGRSLPERQSFSTIALFTIASASFFGTIITGQHSALLLTGIAGALWAIQRDRRFTAGLFLGLLGIKPNWAAIFVLWLLATRRWRELSAMAAVGVVMIASTLPMGLDVWHDYLDALPRWIGALLGSGEANFAYPAHKLVTFEAFTRSTVGLLSPLAGRISWITLEVFAAAACLLVWFRSRSVVDEIAVTVLVAVAANVYVESYDLLVLAVPAAAWWTRRSRYRPYLWKAIGVSAVAIWMWQWSWLIGPADAPRPALVGGLLGLWIAAEAFGVFRSHVTDSKQASPRSAHNAG